MCSITQIYLIVTRCYQNINRPNTSFTEHTTHEIYAEGFKLSSGLCGSLSPSHSATYSCALKSRPSDMEDSSEYIGLAVQDSRKGAVLRLGDWTSG